MKKSLLFRRSLAFLMAAACFVFSFNAVNAQTYSVNDFRSLGTGYAVNTAGTGAGATATAALGLGYVTITNGGSGYASAPAVTVGLAGAGTVGTATCAIGNGQVTGVVIGSGGTGYTAPVITFSGGVGTGASAIALVSSGVITAIKVVSGGTGYTSAPTVTITDAAGTGASATAQYNGVVSVTISATGTGYTSVPTISFAAGASTTTATGTAVLKVVSFTVGNGGTTAAYTTSSTLFTTSGGATIQAAGTVSTVSSGSVTAITVKNGGAGFTSVPSVTFQDANITSVWEKCTVAGSPGTWVTQGLGTTPGSGNNVYIQAGHTIYETVGASGAPVGNLTIASGGAMTTVNSGGGTVSSLYVGGNATINGVLGTTVPITAGNVTAGDGIRMFLSGTGTVTVSGAGTLNIASIRSSGTALSAAQTIVLGMDMQMRNNVTNQTSLTLTGGGGVDNFGRTLTVNAGYLVKLTGGSPAAFGSNSYSTTYAPCSGNNLGNFTFNINGALDCSGGTGTGQFNLETTSFTGSSQNITLSVYGGAVLKLGSIVRILKSLTGQSIIINVADGAVVDGGSVALNTAGYSTTATSQTVNLVNTSNFTGTSPTVSSVNYTAGTYSTTTAGSGYTTTAPLVSFTGGTCSTAPVAYATLDGTGGVASYTVTAGVCSVAPTAVVFSYGGAPTQWFSINGSSQTGIVTRLTTAGTAIPIWIGTNISYNPVTINPTTASITSFSVKDVQPAGSVIANGVIKKRWTITPATASAATIGLGYAGASSGQGDASGTPICDPTAAMYLVSSSNQSTWTNAAVSSASAAPSTTLIPGAAEGVSYSASSGWSSYIALTNVTQATPLYQSVNATAWGTASTWQANTVPPTSTDDAIIATNVTVSAAGAVCRDLTINSGSTLTVNSGITLTVYGNLQNNGTIAGSGTIQMATTGKTFAAGTTNSAILEIAPGSSNTITASASGTVGALVLTSGTMADGGFTITNTGNLSGTGAHTGTGKIKMTGTSKTISGIPTLTNLEIANGAGNTITVGAALSIAGTLTLTSGILNDGGYEITLAGNLAGTSGTHTGYGRLTMTTVSTIAGGITVGNFYQNGNTITANGSFAVSGDLRVNKPGGTAFLLGSNTMTLGGNIINNGGNVATINGTSSTGKVSMTGTATQSSAISLTSISGGTGYAVNDVISIADPNGNTHVPIKLTVNTVSSGAITAATISDYGTGYTSTSPVSGASIANVTSAGGNPATVSVVFTLANTTAKKYLAVGNHNLIINYLELANTVSNNVVSVAPATSRSMIVASGLTFAAGNTSGKILLGEANSTTNNFTIGNSGSAVSVSMNSGNSFSANAAGAGNVIINASASVGTLYFDQTTPGTTNNFAAVTSTLGGATIGNNLQPTALTLTAGTLTVGAGATLTLPATVTVTSGTIDASSSTATIALTNATTIPSGLFNPSTIGNLTVTNAGPTLSQAISVTNTLTVNATNATSYTFANGTNLTMGSGSNYIYNKTSTGDITLNGVPTFSGTVNLSYIGSSAVTTGNEVPTAAGVVNTFTISGGAKVSLNAGLTTASSSTLVLSSGKLLIGLNNLVLASGSSITGASSSNYILSSGGTVTRNGIAANASAVFPIGFTNAGTDYYTPITITNKDASASANITANAAFRTTAVNTSTGVINVQWSALASPSVNTNITFGYTSGNFASGFTAPVSGDLGQYDGSSYINSYSSVSIGATATSYTGLTLPASGTNQFILGNTGAVVALTYTTWTGGTSTDWATASNWSSGILPTSTLDAIIPSGTTFAPLVAASTTVQVNSLSINSSATVTLGSGATITVNGASIINNGTIAGSTGILNLASTGTAQSITGTGNIYNLTINNTNGAAITSGAQTVTGTVTLTGGTFTLAASSLTVNGSLIRTGGSFAGSAPIYNTSVPVTYNGTGATAGNELAPASGSLGILTINSTGTYTLAASKTVTGLALTAGTLADAGFTLTVSGNLSVAGSHSGTGKISMTSAANNATISGSGTLATLEIATGSNTVTVSSAPSRIGNLTLTSGTLADGGKDIVVSGNVTGTGTVSGTGRINMSPVTTQTTGGSATASGSTSITLSAANSSIVVGQYVSAIFSGIASGTTVSTISGTTLTISTATTAAIPAGAALYFSNATSPTLGTSSGTLTLSNLAISCFASVALGGNVAVSGDVAFLRTSSSVTGAHLNDGAYTLSFGGNLFNNTPARIQVNGSSGKLSMTGTATASGLISTGTVAAGNTNGLTAGAATVTFTGGSFSIPAKGLVSTVNTGAVSAITITDPGAGYTSAPTGYSVDGTATSGSVTSPTIATSTSTKYVAVGGQIHVINLELANTTASNTVVLPSNSSLILAGALTFTGANTTGSFTLSNSTSTLYMGGQIGNSSLASGSSISMASTNYFRGGVSSGTAVGTINITSTTVAFGTLYFDPAANYFSGFSLNNTGASGTVVLGNSVAVTSALTLTTGTLSLASGTSFSMYATTITRTSGVIDASNANATVTLANATTIPASTFSPATISNLVVTNASPTLSQAIAVTNGLTLNSTNASTSTFANGSNLTMGAGSSFTYNKTSTGSLVLGGVPTYAGTANFSYTGTVATTMGVEALAATNVINNLVINNAGGVTLNQSQGATVNGALTLTSGKITLGTSNLVLASGATISGNSSSNYVVTNSTGVFTRNSVGNSATLFPIGTTTSYAPLNITNTTGTSNLSTGVQNTYTNQPGDSTQVLKLQWGVLGSAATTATVQYQFNTADFSSAFLVGSTCELGTYKTSYVVSNLGTPTGSNPYTLTASGLSIPASGNNYYVIGNTGNVVVTATTWTGALSTAWATAANWSNGVPTSNVDVVIASASKSPILAASQGVKNLTINSGATLSLNSGVSLSPTLNFTNNGTINGTGTLVLGGTSPQTYSGTGTVASLTLNNSNGATVSSGSSKLNITGVLTLQSGTLVTNSNVVFKSNSIASSGTLAPVGTSGNSGSISGTVTVERYIPSGYRSYRDIAPSVYNTSNTLYNTYQESGSYSKSGYGMFITGGTGVAGTTSTPNSIDANHFDVSANGVKTAYTYINGNWATVANTNVLVTPFTGYRLLIRGDRSFNLYGTGIPNTPLGLLMYNATRLEASGTLVTGNVTYDPTGVSNAVTGSTYANSTYALNNATDSSFNLVANPYVCPVDWSKLTRDSIEGYYYYLDPTIGATGAYVAGNSVSNPYIQAGQAIFIQNKKGYPKYPVIGFTEAAKAPGNQTAVFGISSKLPLALLREETAGSGKYHKMDIASIVFSDSYSNGYNSNEDAPKLDNSSDNLSIRELSATKALSIDGRRPATTGDIIAIQLAQVVKANYQLQIDGSSYNSNGLTPYIYDGYTKTYTALESSLNTISFAVVNTVAATYANRFRIVFKPTVLAVNSITATATLNSSNSAATINWNTVGEDKVTSYTVEKSTDGASYTSICTAAAKNTATAAYSYVDNSVATGTTYYRIKAISTDGSTAYSNVVALTTYNVQLTTYNLYPNPLIGKVLNVKLSNVTAGKYTVSMYNSIGQKVHEEVVSHNGGTATHSLSITEKLANGVYNVTISSANSKGVVYEMSVTVQ
ncbi:T9SS type A sorting domain-containing protein [Parasediminibacterium sp. JCM 36343]|uniref:T9SS type A sorting domain-containing protein n=1 Tax=Parasediminibacterium sp. JCM 36343 TaxID=3374279 RepID=UPI00397E8A35